MNFFLFILITISFFAKGQELKSDFTKHYYAGCAISGFCSSAAYYVTEKPALSGIVGLLSGIFVGIAKEEIFDRQMKRGVPSLDDKFATGFGACLGTMHFAICIHNLRKAKEERENKKWGLYN